MKTKILVCLFSLFWTISKAQPIADCSICSNKILSETMLKDKSLEELALLRNEIFARKGHVFSNEQYQSYFEKQKWYKPAASNSEVKMNEVETKNINLLKSLEKHLELRRNAAMNDLVLLKDAFNSNDLQTIDKFFKVLKTKDPETYEITLTELKTALNKLDLKAIGWNKGNGLYRVTVDNGSDIQKCEIFIEGEVITIKTGMYSHSEIFGDFDDGYSGYHSENEYSLWWVFEIGENGIVFKEFSRAG